MAKDRSTAYFQRLCELPAIESMRAILYHSKLTHADKVVSLCLLLEPRYRWQGASENWELERGVLARIARKLDVSMSTISHTVAHIKSIEGFETRLSEPIIGKHYPFLVEKAKKS